VVCDDNQYDDDIGALCYGMSRKPHQKAWQHLPVVVNRMRISVCIAGGVIIDQNARWNGNNSFRVTIKNEI